MINKIKMFFVKTIWGFIKTHYIISSSILFVTVIGIVAIVVFCNAGKSRPGEVIGSELPSQEGRNAELRQVTSGPIYDVVMEYYTARDNGDEEVILKYCPTISENELDKIAVKSEMFKYSSIECYIQDGLREDSYYVYVVYNLQLDGFEEQIPGLLSFFLCPDELGSYKIYFDDEMTDTVLEDFYLCYSSEAVTKLYESTQCKYNEVLASNEDLSVFVEGFEEYVTEMLKNYVAIKNAQQQAMEPSPEPTPEATTPDTQTTDIIMATTTINVRSSDSETADKLGKISPGTKYTRLENRLNGWSKIEYEGKEGYVKTEYLEVVEETATGNTTSTAAVTVTAKENVNIRATASEKGERLGLVVAGEKLELIEKMSNGWTKIKYNGKEAFVKSEFVE